jgi:signal transduction histidine kinase
MCNEAEIESDTENNPIGDNMELSPEQQIHYLHCVCRIATIANEALQADPFLPQIASEIAYHLAWDRVVLGVLQGDKAPMHLFVATSDGSCSSTTAENPIVTQADLALVQDALGHGSPMILNAADADNPSLVHTLPMLEESGLQTVFSFPIHNNDTPLGAMLVGSTVPRTVSPDEHNLLENIHRMITAALIRISRYEEAFQGHRLRSAFLAKVVHDLRTPTISIAGFAEAMLGGKYGDMPEPVRDAIEMMQYSGNKMYNLINDFLTFSRMEAGYGTIDLTAVDLLPIVRNVTRMVQPQAEKKGLSLETNLPPTLPLVRANSDRVEQVLTNLLSNAIKFSNEGTITVQARQQSNTHIRLSVQDSGIGISPEHQALIFGEYQQIKNQQTLHFEGTGLGLAISRMLVDLMGGTMSLESEFGVGSTFSCDLLIAEHQMPE